jgi:hypothetical protein
MGERKADWRLVSGRTVGLLDFYGSDDRHCGFYIDLGAFYQEIQAVEKKAPELIDIRVPRFFVRPDSSEAEWIAVRKEWFSVLGGGK